MCLLISNRLLMAPDEDDFRIRPDKVRNRGGGQKAARRIGAARGRPTSFRRRGPTWRQSENRNFGTGKGAGRFNLLAGRAHVTTFCRPATPAADPILNSDDFDRWCAAPATCCFESPTISGSGSRKGLARGRGRTIIVAVLRHTMAAEKWHESGFDRDLVGEAG